jgi:hypothetical protein
MRKRGQRKSDKRVLSGLIGDLSPQTEILALAGEV